MMDRREDFAPFESMAPYSGEVAKRALKTLLDARDWTGELGRMIPTALAEKLVQQWRGVESIEAFQENVVKPFLQGLMSQTT